MVNFIIYITGAFILNEKCTIFSDMLMNSYETC
jgi:hypothetical protein